MEEKELQKTIDRMGKILEKIGGINIYDDCSYETGRKMCQTKLHNSYNDLFDLRKHLIALQNKNKNGGAKKWVIYTKQE